MVQVADVNSSQNHFSVILISKVRSSRERLTDLAKEAFPGDLRGIVTRALSA